MTLWLARFAVVVMPIKHSSTVPSQASDQDQVDALVRKGIKAGRIDSSQDNAEYMKTVAAMRDGTLKLLYVAPERLNMEGFMGLISQFDLELLAVDEAHCVSEWGASFRPDYLKIARFVKENHVKRVLCLTATATEEVAIDIANAFNIDYEESVFQVPSYRPNLRLNIESIDDDVEGAKRIQRSMALIKASPGPTIIYITTQKNCEAVAQSLTLNGIEARFYHAGMDNDARKHTQDWFMTSPTAVVCATIAFGMGIDKADIRNVIHFNLPKTLEGYSQEVGRAGRDGQPSNCTLFLFAGDKYLIENFARGNSPSKASVRSMVQHTCIQAIAQGVAVNDFLEINGYQVSRDFDIRDVTLALLYASMELDFGFLRAGTPLYAVYEYYPNSNLYNLARGDSSVAAKAIHSHAAFGRTKYTIDVANAAESTAQTRDSLVVKLNEWHDRGWITLKASQRRNRYRVLKNLPRDETEIFEVADKMFAQMIKRENNEVERADKVLQWASRAECLPKGLAKHFGDGGIFSTGETCGHCTVCKQGGQAATVYQFTAPAFDEVRFQQVLNLIPVRDDARYIARVAFGISSPRTTAERVTKSAEFGCMVDHLWDEVLARCDEESAKWWKANPNGPPQKESEDMPTAQKRKASTPAGGSTAKRGRGASTTGTSTRGRGRGRGRGAYY